MVVGTNNRVYIWRKDNEVNNPHLVCPAPRREVSVLVWGCLSYCGIGTLCHVEGTINAQKYIIDKDLWPLIASHFGNNEYTFMDDNAPVHRANIVKTYKETIQINEIEWPAQSPDINIIEYIWLRIKRDIEYHVTTRQQLFDVIRGA